MNRRIHINNRKTFIHLNVLDDRIIRITTDFDEKAFREE